MSLALTPAPAQTGQTQRRIIVAVDEGADALTALQEAARLAAATSSKLVALFVEDVAAIHAAQLSASQLVCSVSGICLPLEQTGMERGMRVRARRIRQKIAETAEALHIEWEFAVTRGRVVEEILRQAGEYDLFAIGASLQKLQRSAGRSLTTELLQRLEGNVYAARAQRAGGARTLAVYAGAPDVLQFAGRFAERSAGAIFILPLGAHDRPADESAKAGAAFRWLPPTEENAQALLSILEALRPGTLIVGRKLLQKLALRPGDLLRLPYLGSLLIARE